MHRYIGTYIYTWLHSTYIHGHIDRRVNGFVVVHMNAYTQDYMCIIVYSSVCVFMCVCACVCACL